MTPPDDNPPRYRSERDKRVTDPQQYLNDKLLEAESMIAQWERSLDARRAPGAAEQLHYWRTVRTWLLERVTAMEVASER